MTRTFGKTTAAVVLIAGLTTAIPDRAGIGASPAWAAHHEKTESQGTVKAGDIKREWAEAIDALKGYSAAQRDKALEKSKNLLAVMDSRIEMLESRTQDDWKKLNEEARQKRRTTLRNLRKKRSQVAEWYGGMKHSSGAAWRDVKRGFVSAYGALADSFAEAANEF